MTLICRPSSFADQFVNGTAHIKQLNLDCECHKIIRVTKICVRDYTGKVDDDHDTVETCNYLRDDNTRQPSSSRSLLQPCRESAVCDGLKRTST